MSIENITLQNNIVLLSSNNDQKNNEQIDCNISNKQKLDSQKSQIVEENKEQVAVQMPETDFSESDEREEEIKYRTIENFKFSILPKTKFII